MNNRIFICVSFCLALLILGCSKDNIVPKELPADEPVSVLKKGTGAVQISGVGVYSAPGDCAPPPGPAPSYAITMTGDLEGCLYGFIDEFDCSPSGTYREEGREFFVGTYKGEPGTFWTTYKFAGKFEGCAANGAPLGLEIFGRCQHPITAGIGTGVFEGATGRLDFKDDVASGSFPYRGHIKL